MFSELCSQKRDIRIPPDDTLVWRYMDMAKLLSIFEKKSLFFPSIALLQESDPWEGSFSNVEFGQHNGGTSESRQDTKDMFLFMTSKIASRQLAVSCWHMSNHESNALWKIYTDGSEGVALRITFGQLKDSFDFNDPEWPLDHQGKKVDFCAGAVDYIDWDALPRSKKYPMQAFYKHESFEDEKEFRIVAMLRPFLEGIGPAVGKKDRGTNVKTLVEDISFLGLSSKVEEQIKNHHGVYFPVKVEALVENIFISPVAPAWFKELVEKLVKTYKLNSKIHWNNAKPPY